MNSHRSSFQSVVEAETLSWKSTWVVGATGSCGDVEDCRDALGVALGGQGLGGGRVWGIGGDVDLPGDSVFGRVGHGLVSCHVGGDYVGQRVCTMRRGMRTPASWATP